MIIFSHIDKNNNDYNLKNKLWTVLDKTVHNFLDGFGQNRP
jgi:hypothetical protein